jgi:hypothetical protein
MKHLANLLIIGGLLFFSSLVYSSCQKELNNSNSASAGQQHVQIRLSDNPIPFSAVNVNIQMVEVQLIPDSCRSRSDEDDDGDDDHQGDNDDQGDDDDHDHDGGCSDHDSRCAVWDTLNIHPGVYNLLHLANGTDTILASGFTVAGKINKIRLTLGDHNSVVIDSVSYPLTLFNDIHHVTICVGGGDVDMISPSSLQLWLDFDAGRSIVRLDNNHFVLRPLLRLWLPSHTASVSGRIFPGRAHAIVAAIFTGDTLVAIPRPDDGYFKIRGITTMTTDLFINATANNYRDTTITGISLTIGSNKDIGTIQLHQ